MNNFKEDMEAILHYCERIENQKHRTMFIHLLHWVQNEFHLVPCYEWRIPSFASNNLVVAIGFDKDCIIICVNGKSINKFKDEIEKCHYDNWDNQLIIKWSQNIDFDLLTKIINFEKNVSKYKHHSSKSLPLEIKYSNDSWPGGHGFANFHIKYDRELNAYVGSNQFHKSIISVDAILNVIEKYEINSWKYNYYEFADWEMQIYDGSWWNLEISYEKSKFSSRGGCEFGPKFLDNFEGEMIKLFSQNIDPSDPGNTNLPWSAFAFISYFDYMDDKPLKIIVNYNTPFPLRDGLYVEIEYNDKLNALVCTTRTQYGKYHIIINAQDVINAIHSSKVTEWKTNYIPEEHLSNDDDFWEVVVDFGDRQLISQGNLKHHPKKFHNFKNDIAELAEAGIRSTENSYFFENPHSALLFSMIEDKFTK